MTHTHNELQLALLNTYLGNLVFLQQYDENLYTRISSLSNAIDNGTYQERYFLEFLEKELEFDIFDSSHNSYIYNKKPRQWLNKIYSSVKFDHTNSISYLDTVLFINPKSKQSSNQDNIFQKNFKKLNNDLSQFSAIIHQPFYIKKTQLSKIEKFMFVGTLAGRHIPHILELTQAKLFFVCEEDLELFRLSLFVCDYSLLARDGKNVIFSIMDDEPRFMKQMLDFFQIDILKNGILKFATTNHNVVNNFERITNRLLSLSPTTFNYYMYLDLLKSTTTNLCKYGILPLRNDDPSLYFLQNKNVLFLAPGPSLKDHIEFVKLHQDKFIIVCVARAFHMLIDNGIKPDIITTIDPQKIPIWNQLLSKKEYIPYLKNTIILASVNTNSNILSKLKKVSNLFLFELTSSIFANTKSLLGASVGEITYALISSFNPKTIYLLGTDLAVHQNTGASHSSESFKQYDISANKQKQSQNLYSLRGDLIHVQGNLISQVTTTRLFYSSLKYYNATAKQNLFPTYNLCTHGLYISNTQPLLIEDLNLNSYSTYNKKDLHETLLKNMANVIISKVVDEDFQYISSHLLLIEEMLKAYNDFNIHTIHSYEQFNQLALNLLVVANQAKFSISYLFEILYSYCIALNTYIYNCYNIDTNNFEVHIQDISKIWITQVRRLLREYHKILTSALK